MIKWKDVAHLYLGCECQTPEGVMQMKAVYTDSNPVFYDSVDDFSYDEIKPILRPLSDMTEEEMKELLLVLLNDLGGEKDEQVCALELGEIEMFYNDGGLMVDENVAVGANFSVRCLEGQFCITNDGSPCLWDLDADRHMIINNQSKITLYLLSRHFDLFGLIETNQAIKK